MMPVVAKHPRDTPSQRLVQRIGRTDGSRQWIEDCQVCCRPMQITITTDDDGELEAVRAERLD